MILTENELRNRYVKIKRISENDISDAHHKKYGETIVKPGQFFLYENVVNETLSYPKIGLYIDSYMVDMALEVEWIDVRRTWEYNAKYKYDYNGKEYYNFVSDKRKELQTLIIWDDVMFVYGIWDVLPNWKELKLAYDKTIWFKRDIDVIRTIRINNILK